MRASSKSQGRKDFEKKRNLKDNLRGSKGIRLREGDGVLPKSVKFKKKKEPKV